MNTIYEKNSANYPGLDTDVLFDNSSRSCMFAGFVDNNIRFIEDFQLLDTSLWERFVKQFIEFSDSDDLGWRGEYWGKMMRGASMTYSYTKNQELYKILTKTVIDMMNTADENGRISSYNVKTEFDGWDMWSRKYVLLGMQYFLEICTDENLYEKIVDCMKKQLDYIIAKIGNEAGKKAISVTSRIYRGLNSASILEPVVRLYNITGEKKYLDFAEYIVECGVVDVENIFELAYENKLYPYQYPITKAYEMISCFEGLIEYYRATKIEKYKYAVINFADKILESDFTIIGSCGCTHEFLDHSTVRQANVTDGLMQETCVTVTIMKYLYKITLLTGNPKYVDAFEISMYNAYFGSINTERVSDKKIAYKDCPGTIVEALPFDSYSPLTAGLRGRGIGGQKTMSDNHYYGCCACIGSAGNGMIPKMTLLERKDGYALNLFINGVITTDKGQFVVETEYPKCGDIIVNVDSNEEFSLYIRIPAWSKNTEISLNGENVSVAEGYTKISRRWEKGDAVRISLDMNTYAKYPVKYGYDILMNKVAWEYNYIVPNYDEQTLCDLKHIALIRGPVVLAQENRLGYSVDDEFDITVNEDGTVDAVLPAEDVAPFRHIVEVKVPLRNKEYITLTDYSSAGKLWNEESKMAAWIKTK